jgi:predicted RNA binding protein YcfA (HicA-like mRNA interferase family)
VSKKEKLLEKLLSQPPNFTWDEAVKLMKQHNFELVKNSGSKRVFKHASGLKVFLHEPHPQNTLLNYAMETLIEGLKSAGEIK